MNNIVYSYILNVLVKADLTRAQEIAILDIIQPEVVEGYQNRIAELEEENARLRASEARLRNTTNEATERARVYQETNRTLLEQLQVRDHVMAKSLLDFVNTTNQTHLSIEQTKSLMLETSGELNQLGTSPVETAPVTPRISPTLIRNNPPVQDCELKYEDDKLSMDAPMDTEPDYYGEGGKTYAHEILSRHSRYSKSLGNCNNNNGNQ